MTIRLLSLVLLALAPSLLGEACWSTSGKWSMLAGQSNMVGNSNQAKLPAQQASVWRGYWNLSIVEPQIQDPRAWGSQPEGFLDRTSSAPSFAMHTPWKDHLITVAKGSACLRPDMFGAASNGAWHPVPVDPEDPNTVRVDPPDIGWAYYNAYKMWEAAGEPKLEWVLWLQGECEGGWWHTQKIAAGETDQWQYENSYASYYDALLNFADHVWSDFGAPVIAAPVNLRGCTDAYLDNPDMDGSGVPDPDMDGTCSVLGRATQKLEGVHDATIDAAMEHPHLLLGPVHDCVYSADYSGHTWDVNRLGELWARAVQGEDPQSFCPPAPRGPGG